MPQVRSRAKNKMFRCAVLSCMIICPRSGILVLIGLPGSGKSTLAQKLALEATSKYNLPPNRVKIIQYDEIYNDIQHKSSSTSFDATLWHRSRVEALHQASSFVSSLQNNPGDAPSLIIIDDNMFYRSMRFPFYKLARKHQIGFLQLYLKTDVEICVQRDAQRSQHVSEATIRRMQERLEPPDATKFDWESNCIVLDSVESDSTPFETLLDRVFGDFSQVPPPLVDGATTEQERSNARENNMKSFGHQLDLQLRKIVSQALSADLSQDIKKKLGPQIHKMKQHFLDDATSRYEVEEGETISDACTRAAHEFTNQVDIITQRMS